MLHQFENLHISAALLTCMGFTKPNTCFLIEALFVPQTFPVGGSRGIFNAMTTKFGYNPLDVTPCNEP
jgi:hypothetical protein